MEEVMNGMGGLGGRDASLVGEGWGKGTYAWRG